MELGEFLTTWDMMKVCIKTYGCQMNVRDSEAMAVMLHANGHEIVHDESDAEAVVFNTCSIRKKAEDKAIGTLQQAVAAGKKRRIIAPGSCPNYLSHWRTSKPATGQWWISPEGNRVRMSCADTILAVSPPL